MYDSTDYYVNNFICIVLNENWQDDYEWPIQNLVGVAVHSFLVLF